MLRVVIGLSLVLAPTAALSAQRPMVLQRSLAPFASPDQQLGTVGAASALPSDSSNSPRSPGAGREPTQRLWPVDVLRAHHAAAIERGELAVDVILADEGGGGQRTNTPSVVLRGADTAVIACRDELERLLADVARPILVEAWHLPLPSGPLPDCVASPAQLQQLLASATPRWHARTVTRGGGQVFLGREHWLGIVRDVDVEVAQSSRISDPKVDAAFEGVKVGLAVHALPGDRLLLEGDWLLSEHVATTELATGPNGQPTVNLPRHRTAYLTFAGSVDSGGALLVSGRMDGRGPADFLLVVRAAFAAPAPPRGNDGGRLAVSALTAAPLVLGLPRVFDVPGDDGSPLDARGPRGPRMQEEPLRMLLGEATGAAVEVHAGTAIVAGDTKLVDRCAALVDQLLSACATTRELRCELRSGDRTIAAIHQPVLFDRTAQAFVGEERSIVVDHEVEISESAAMTNPVVGGRRAGLWWRAAASDAGPAPVLDGCWLVATQGPLRIHQHSSSPPATLQLGDATVATFPWLGPIAAGRPTALGDGPGWTPDSPATQLTIELRAP
ncbi:MAG: hypothetical protein H6838_07760 [Planctomycetes bacterium]|nr:hypothetical protein [Planctomycetota bacterium]